MKALALSIFENKNLSPLAGGLADVPLPALVSGLGAAQRAQLAAALKLREGRPLVVISPDESAAEAMAADLSAFLGITAEVMGSREFTFYRAEGVSRPAEHRRLRVLDRLARGAAEAVVLTAAALLQRTLPPDMCRQVCFSLSPGSCPPPEEIVEKLLRCGYRSAGQVEGPGQFARRGGILDIWSPGEDTPARLDYFGDELDTLFSFDPSSQRRTVELKSLRVLPGAETLPTLAEGGPQGVGEAIMSLRSRVSRTAARYDSEALRKTLAEDAEALTQAGELAAADRYMELIFPQMTTALDYLPGEALVVLDQPGKCAERAGEVLKQANEDIRLLTESGTLSGRLARFWLNWEEALKSLLTRPVVFADSFAMGRYPADPQTIAAVTARQLPSYAGSAEAAAADVKRWLAEGYRCVVLAGDARRAKLLWEFLRRQGVERAVLDETPENLPAPGCCAVSVGGLSAGMEYPQSRLCVLTDTMIARGAAQQPRRKRAVPAGARLGSYEDLSVGDLVVHETHGIGRFAGIFRMPVDGAEKDYIKICYAGTDSLYIPATQLDLVTKYIGAGQDSPVRLSRLGGTDWNRARSRARASAKKMAAELIRIYSRRQAGTGHAFAPDSPWQTQFEEAFEYTETEDQLRCAREIKKDMESTVPMDRLLCGDVGYGKTEVALRAVMKCVLDGWQAAILVPTTVLARQHYQTAVSRFFGFPICIRTLSRFTAPAEARRVLAELKSGECDIVIGTHKLLQKGVSFKKLGLLIVDEEQRFGVSHKEHIKELTAQVDVLTLSATPIPRTLNMALSGIRDMSTLSEPPRDRLPVQTTVMEHDWEVLTHAMRRELARGGQVYYLHNRIDSIDHTAARIQKLLPEASVDVAHGRMNERELSTVMDKVIDGRTQILVCTTIIETGIDIPNVNTLIIEDADKMGLAQLHQIRGRVGRSSRRAAAYLTYRRDKVLSEVAEKRLEAIREFAEFNSGYRIAMRDLEIRGAGNLLGAEQSGHMIDVGYDMYLKLLEEAVREERGQPAQVHTECSADLAVSANIPETYIKSPEQRMDIYRRVALIRTREEADDITDELVDRFGALPPEVMSLIRVALLRGRAARAGITDITQKGGTLRFLFQNFDFAAVSALYAREPWQGRVKVQAGTVPAVGIRLRSGRRVLEEALAFVEEYQTLRTPVPQETETQNTRDNQ